MRVLVISGSLHPMSRSRVMARRAYDTLVQRGVEAEWVDLRGMQIDLCDGTGDSKGGDLPRLSDAIEAAQGILVSVPIYNFDVNAAVKNLIEQTGRAWTDTAVGFLCAAGGRASYMSVMSLANSLMLDFRCVIVPRFVYAMKDDFRDDRTESMALGSDEVAERIGELATEVVRLAEVVSPSD